MHANGESLNGDTNSTVNPSSTTQTTRSGSKFEDESQMSIIHREVQHEEPTFDIDQVQLQFNIKSKLKRLCVQNNIMYLILDRLVFKINLNNPSEVKHYQLSNSTDIVITDCWLSPNGCHFICQINNTMHYYLHDSYDKFKILPRFKNLLIKFITFPSSDNEDSISTGDILVTTTDGTIYVSNIKSHDPKVNENKKDDKYIRLVYKCTKFSNIYGVFFTNNDSQINLFLDNKILQWDCFDHSYSELSKVFKIQPNVVETSTSSNLVTYSNGSHYILLSVSNNAVFSNDNELQLSQTEKLNTPTALSKERDSLILSDHHVISLSNDHKQLLICNKLSNRCKVLELHQYLSEKNERVLGIVADKSARTYWIYSQDNIFELLVNNESVSVWYNYFKMGKYNEALKCLDDTASRDVSFLKKDMILIRQGYDYLQQGAFGIDYGEEESDSDLINLQVKGIKVLGELSEPFEKICLMLLNMQHTISGNPNSRTNLVSERLLIEYLLVKFYLAKNQDKNKIRIVVLSSWIIDLMLRVIYKLEDEIQMNKATNYSIIKAKKELSIEAKERILGEFNDKFYAFLNLNYKFFDRKTVYQIIEDMNYHSKLLYLAELDKDYEFVLNYYIDLQEWQNATQTLIKMYSDNFHKYEEIIYKKSTILLISYPQKIIETWLKFSEINYDRLLPAILTYNKNNSKIPLTENYSIQFLQRLIYSKGVKSKTINNYYLSLLITYPTTKPKMDVSSDEDTMKYINKQIIKFLNHAKSDMSGSNKLYDSGFILRLCLGYKHVQPAVLILINDMKLFEPALKLSLDSNLTNLAVYILNKYNDFLENNGEMKINSDDFEISHDSFDNGNDTKDIGKSKLEEENFGESKKLWLMFADYLIKGVCDGKEFDILNDIRSDDTGGYYGDTTLDSSATAEDENSNGKTSEDLDHHEKEKNNKDSDVSKDLTANIVDSMNVNGSEKEINIPQDKANKVLKYLLDSSYNKIMNSSILSLKDLLPLFPETVMINNFKDEIIRSLNQYNNKINSLSLEMKESLNISNKLKAQIKESNEQENKGKIYTIIEPGEPCRFCDNLLVNKNFISFPNCHHNFHKECLVRYYLLLKGDYRFKKVFQNFKKNNTSENKKELDEIMLNECILCNESNIISIDNNLIDTTKDDALISDWAL